MAVAKWWKTTAWPWTKENWWAVLLAPVAVVVLLLMFLMRGKTGVVLAPTAEADARALEEEKTRNLLLERENSDLIVKVRDLEAVAETLQTQMENRVAEEVEELRNDPEKLRDLMLRNGPG